MFPSWVSFTQPYHSGYSPTVSVLLIKAAWVTAYSTFVPASPPPRQVRRHPRRGGVHSLPERSEHEQQDGREHVLDVYAQDDDADDGAHWRDQQEGG